MANAKIVNTPSQAIPQSNAVHSQKTISSAAVNVITFTLQTDTTHVLVQFNGSNCRVTFDGSTPTASFGFLYTDGASAYWTKTMATKAKAIRIAGTDVIAEIQELNFL